MGRSFKHSPLSSIALLLLASCGGAATSSSSNIVSNEAQATPEANASAASFTWPESLRPFGEGYPNPGDPCRRLGESPAVADYLDDSADLVGCPAAAADAVRTLVEARRSRALSTIEGVVVLSVPQGNSGPATSGDGQRGASDGDALVPGTTYNATGTVRCTVAAGQPARNCDAGVVRNRDGTAIVTVTWPDRRTRALFFAANGTVSGADTNQADGSARHEVRGRRDNDTTVVTIGPERYEIPDVFIQGD